MKMICPHCGLKGTAGEALLGKKVRCPECQQVFRVNEDVAMITVPAPEVSDVIEEHVESVEAEDQEAKEVEKTLELPGDDIDDDGIILEDDGAEVKEIDMDDLTKVIDSVKEQDEDVAEAVLADGVKVCSKCGFALSEFYLQEIDGNMECSLCAA